jgi:signal transduction histidine kinase
MTRSALAEMRELLLELRPTALEDTELGDLLRQLTESIGGRAELTTDVEIEGRAAVPAELKLALYRIAQEALNNVAKHAATGRARVRLRSLPGRVELKIEDDGRGFDPRQIPAASMGLKIMRERAEAVGAQLQIGSREGQGSWVQVDWVETPSEEC